MPGWGLLLAPGSGASSSQSALVAIDNVATAIGGCVRRMDFPYRLAGRRAPDKAEVLVRTVAEQAEVLAAAHGLAPGRLFLGGRSMGGRVCSMAVADGLPAAGLVLVSYPLHPPGHPEKPRTAHLAQIQVPCLFVSGTRDAFGTPTELEEATANIPGAVTHQWVDGADHSMRGKDKLVAEGVAAWLGAMVARYPPASR